jgi:DNA-binding NtrC family response regulator
MKDDPKIIIFLVDDDALFLKLLTMEFLQKGDFIIETFPTGESCIENLSKNPDLIVLDYHLDSIEKKSINGIQTLDEIRKYNAKIPVIMLSSQDKIEVAIDCMHHGVNDYIVKSETAFLRLLSIIEKVFKYQKIEKQLKWYMDRM